MNNEPIKILIVDDTPENLVAFEALLRRNDVELITARSGAEALEQCLRHDFSLALLDVQMPEMDGFELAELMRGAERTKHIPIVFVTAGSRDQARLFKGYETGAVDFLHKPIEPQILASKVNVFIELAAQRRALADSLRINELFVGILGHDLRNPLSAMLAGIDLMSMLCTEEAQLKALTRMRNSGGRMQSMVEDMLDLTHARLTPGLGLARVRAQVDLHDILSRTIDELHATHHRELRLEGPTCHATGDPERLMQMFSNLLANAVVHGRADTPVTARIIECDASAVVEIHNVGMISPELAPTLFEPFKRAKTSSKGLGLGLFIAKQIAQAHGGDIGVTSSEAAGTTFTVTLPRRPT